MRIARSEILASLRPGENNPRNSEGAFIRCKDGTILYAYSRYSSVSWMDEAPADIAAIRLSADGKQVLSETPEILVRASEYEGIENIMSVSFLRMENGDLGLFYIIKHETKHLPGLDCIPAITEYVMRRSVDDITFPAETEVLCTSPHMKCYFVVNNDRVLRTSSGRILVPTARHRGYRRANGTVYIDGNAEMKICYSDDDGRTWQEAYSGVSLPSAAHSTPWFGLQEPGLVELAPGTIYLYARSDKMLQYESFSPDNGLSWTPAQPSGFTSPPSPMKIAKNPFSGRYYSIWNPIPNYNGRAIAPTTAGRTPLVLAESEDCIRFGEYAVIEGDPDRGFCYPAIHFLSANELLISYCAGLPSDGNCLCATTLRRLTLD